MDWKKPFRKAGLPGLVVIGFVIFVVLYWVPYFVNSASSNMDVMSAGVLKPLAKFQNFATGKTSPFWAPPVFLLTGLLFMVGFPLVSFAWLFQLAFRRVRPAKSEAPREVYRNTDYETNLGALVQAVNKLKANDAVPEILRRSLVKVIRLLEASVIEIIGIENRAHCRMMWIVMPESKSQLDNSVSPTIWARKKDGDLYSNEEIVVQTCLIPSWFTALDNVKSNPLFEPHKPEKMEALVCARNLTTWNVGFVLAIDQPFTLTNEMKMALLAHMSLVMPLWDMDSMRNVMLQLQKEDWEEVDIR